MPLQQERARRTRAAIVESAAAEFAKRGFAAASINLILEHSGATKGAMYFHFKSKEDLARAVLEEGLDHYRAIVDRWVGFSELDPFERLHGMICDLGEALHNDVIIAAEFRLVIDPEFVDEAELRGTSVWGHAGYRLAEEAEKLGLFRPGVDLRRFVGAVGSSLAGQRYLADLTAPGVGIVAARHADPRTTMRYDRARKNLDRHPNYILGFSFLRCSSNQPTNRRTMLTMAKW